MPSALARTARPAEGVEEDLDARLRTIEHRIGSIERRGRREPDPDAIAAGLEELAEAVAGDVVGEAETRIRSSVAAQQAETRIAIDFATDRIAKDAAALIERTGRVVERELAQQVATATADLRRALAPPMVRTFVATRSFQLGEEVAHAGGVWRCIAAGGSRGEAPSPNAACWLLTSDGVDEVTFRSDPGDRGGVVVEATFASGRKVASVMAAVMPAFRGGYAKGKSYPPMSLVSRDGSMFLATKSTDEDPSDSKSGAWVLLAARGQPGPGPTASQMSVAEDFIIGKVSEVGTHRERVAIAIDDADDFWRALRPAQRHANTLIAYAEMALGEGIVVLAGAAARPASVELAQRVGTAVLGVTRETEGGGEAAVLRAQEAIREVAGLLLPQGRAERLLDALIERSDPSDRPLVVGLKVLVGR